MPSFCVVKNCEDKYTHSENVSFHKFPHSRKELLERWTEFACRGPDWKPSKWSAICSRHFLPEDFRNVNSRKALKKTAIPTVRPSESDQISQIPPLENHSDEFKLPDSSCRLCGICCRPVATFATNFEIFGMIQKCFPTLNIQLDDNLPKDMCSGCLKRLNSFSEFVDAVLDTQKVLQGKFRSEKFMKPPERQLKIKQEPVVNVKQEVGENFDSFLSDDLEEDQDCEQKFPFCDFPMLNTQDIINNCDIMEIINLDDPFIDIPDDENGNEVDHIDQVDYFEPKSQHVLNLGTGLMIHEHNYALPIECKDSIPFANVYKTEKAEEKEEAIVTNAPPSTLITAKPKYSNNRTIVSEPARLNSNFLFSDTSNSAGKIMVTSVSNLQPLPSVETSTKKPNIVVLNESIVKTASAFQLHPCSMCQSQFFSSEGLSHHIINAHMHPTPMVSLPMDNLPVQEVAKPYTKSISCPSCSMSFVTIQGLLKHKHKAHSKTIPKREKRGRECPVCEKFFISKVALKNHRQYVCQTKVLTTSNTFKCRYCQKNTFGHWRIYRNHETLCKRRRTKKPQQPKKVSKSIVVADKLSKEKLNSHAPDDSNLLCLGCDKRFNLVDCFRLHYINEQCKFKPSSDEVLAFCRTCNKPITTFTKIRSHRHFKVSKKYQCKDCPKVFTSSNLLSQHRITHSNVRKHKCELCEKIFKRRGGLQQHMKGYHLKMKPHECGVCKRRFALKADMSRCKHSSLKY